MFTHIKVVLKKRFTAMFPVELFLGSGLVVRIGQLSYLLVSV